jgi:hypothetical protein
VSACLFAFAVWLRLVTFASRAASALKVLLLSVVVRLVHNICCLRGCSLVVGGWLLAGWLVGWLLVLPSTFTS